MGRGDGHECPFGKSSIALVKLLCRLLNIGEQRKLLSRVLVDLAAKKNNSV
jgi:hypothetical protein